MTGKLLCINDAVADRAGKSKLDPHRLVLKFWPEDTRGIQKLQRFIDRHPLLCARDTGAILRFCRLASGNLVDKRRFPNIRDAEHHHAHDAPDLSFFLVGAQLLAQKLTHGGGKAIRAGAAFGVHFQNGTAARAEICRPLLRLRRVRLIDPVQHNKARLSNRKLVDIGVAARHRDARVEDLAHGVHVTDLGSDHAARLCHVTGKPA